MKNNNENTDMSNDFIDIEQKRNNDYIIVIVLYIIVIILFILLIFSLKHQKSIIVDNNLNNANNQNVFSNNNQNFKDIEDLITDTNEEKIDGNIKEEIPSNDSSIFREDSSILDYLE